MREENAALLRRSMATFGNFFHRSGREREENLLVPSIKNISQDPGTIPFGRANPSVCHSQTRSINQRVSAMEKEGMREVRLREEEEEEKGKEKEEEKSDGNGGNCRQRKCASTPTRLRSLRKYRKKFPRAVPAAAGK